VRPRASELVGWGASQRARSASLDHLEEGRVCPPDLPMISAWGVGTVLSSRTAPERAGSAAGAFWGLSAGVFRPLRSQVRTELTAAFPTAAAAGLSSPTWQSNHDPRLASREQR
jgi:hypothetical protein